MKVAIYQTSPVLLDLKANLEDVISKILQGREKGAQLIAFPELALTGYFVGQDYHEVALRLDSEEIVRLASATKGTAAVDGEIAFTYRKLNLPNYGVFEERKYFSPGKQIPVLKLHDFNIAVFICNDLWHPSLPYLGVVQKADIFVTMFNSSQGSMGTEFSNIESWAIINKFYSRIFGIYNICANRVGEETFEERRAVSNVLPSAKDAGKVIDDRVCQTETYKFWGGSEIVNPFGQIIVQAALHEPDEIFGDIERDLLRQKKILLPYLRNDDPYFTHRELQRILYDKKFDDT
jgi:predicted amidohydrolase